MSEGNTGPRELSSRVIVIKNDGAVADINSNALSAEDDFKGLYGLGVAAPGVDVLEPPYNLQNLAYLAERNNALLPCIDAMVTNVAGTGFVIEARDNKEAEGLKAEVEAVQDFFDEPWPGESWVTTTKKVRRDIEALGMGYVEALRDPKGSLAMLRYVDGRTMRMVQLQDAFPAQKQLLRRGKMVTYTVMVRERMFCQRIAGTNTFFKPFGSTRTLHKRTGQWFDNPKDVSPKDRATEIIQFGCMPDSTTPYSIPRWIPQVPSVLGSRKAEEHNLSFFDAGGVPPMMILVQGGTLAPKAVEAITEQLQSSGTKNRAAVVEAYANQGSIDGKDTVRVTVERFGAERQQDSMFEGYDIKCEQRIRRAFRLPPIFVGAAADYSFASAYVSYTVTEAQVFLPERDEFDEVINLLVIPELTDKPIRYRSKALTVKDVSNQLKALELAAKYNALSRDGLVETLNEVTTMDMQAAQEGDEPLTPPPTVPVGGQPGGLQEGTQDGVPSDTTPAKQPTPTQKSEEFTIALAEEASSAINVKSGDLTTLAEAFGSLSPKDATLLKGLVAMKTFTDIQSDPAGLSALAGCSMAVLASQMPKVN